MPNALANETSPYLRQHAENPVDWLPWGPQALARAKAEQKPLLVSIGYSACHWCHVMERESFEDEHVARLMNESFVCVKVDREERPDVDAIYLEAVQAMSGHGGWPLNVFLTPEQLPFFGGTYYPPQPRNGMPSWTQVLEAIAAAWREQSAEIRENVQQLRSRLAGAALLKPSQAPFDPNGLSEAVERLRGAFDAQRGGFGGAPKFPQPTVVEYLLSEAAIGSDRGAETRGERETTEIGGDRGAAEMALTSLKAIAAGGIHDLVGGGFHRYAVDAHWTVPHFEKMLYDNALLSRAYLHAHELTGDPRLLDVCLSTLKFMLREMRCPEGGFYAALDADSGGVEGAFYVWTLGELRDALGEDAEAAIAWTGASERGNFLDPHHPQQGLNVLTDRPDAPRPPAAAVERIRARLLAAREARERPGLDDKRIASWNALAISALAEAGAFLVSVPPTADLSGGPANADASNRRELGKTLLSAATRCAEFVFERLMDEQGRLLRAYSAGGAGDAAGAGGARAAQIGAFLEDHAFLLEALLALYEATFEERWLTHATALADTILSGFADAQNGGFFSTAADAEPLIARRKEIEDTPIPSGASSAALGLLRLAALTGERSYEQAALSTLRLVHELAPQHPQAFGHLLQALRLHVSPIAEVAIVGPPGPQRDALVRVVREAHRPGLVLAVGPGDGTPSAVPLLTGRTPIEGRPAAYVCERFSCLRPVAEPRELRELLDTGRAARTR